MTMNTKTRNIGLIALGAAALVYPGVLLYRYIARRRRERAEQGEGDHMMKHFAPAYRGASRAHNRKAESNGTHNRN